MILLLNILKVIAGILIFLLLLILLLLFLVLFVPVRYRAEGRYGTESVSFRGKLTYLLRFISLQISYETGLQIRLKLLGIPVFDSLKEKKPKKRKAPKAPKKKKKEETGEKAPPKPEEPPAQWEPLQEAKKEGKLLSEAAPSETKKTASQKNSSSQKGKASDDSPNKKSPGDILEVIGRYLELWQREETRLAFAFGRQTIFKVLRVFLPGKWYLRGHVGFEDPALTGYLMAALGILYPTIGNHIVIVPDFENEILEVEGKAKGHITFAAVLVQFIRIVSNKHCRKFFKLFRSTVSGEKQEETNGRQ